MCNKKKKLLSLSNIIIVITLIFSAILIIKNKTKLKNKFINKENDTLSVKNNKLDLYFANLVKYFKYDLLSDYKGYFFSIKIENIQNLEKEYSEIKVNKIKFPFQSESLIENIDDIKLYLKEELEKNKVILEQNKENDYDYLLKEVKKVLLKKSHYEILNKIKPFIIDEKELEKWEELYNSNPDSMLI